MICRIFNAKPNEKAGASRGEHHATVGDDKCSLAGKFMRVKALWYRQGAWAQVELGNMSKSCAGSG